MSTKIKSITCISDQNDKRDSFINKIPKLKTKIEGHYNGIKTVLINIVDVAAYLHTEPSYVTKFLGMECGSLSQYDCKRRVGIVYGVHSQKQLQPMLNKYLTQFVFCPKCNLPELLFKSHQKKNVLLNKCCFCDWKGKNSSTHKVKMYMINHPSKLYKHYKTNKYKDEILFMNACENFKTIDENADLLLHGYIRVNTNNFEIYNQFPLDIIYLIFSICYNYKFLETKDKTLLKVCRKMPNLQTKIEIDYHDSIKTVLTNIEDIATYLHTKASYLTKFCGIEVKELSRYDDENKVGIVYGIYKASELETFLKKYVRKFIVCVKCNLPKLVFKKQKHKRLSQICESCGWNRFMINRSTSSTHKVIKYISSHISMEESTRLTDKYYDEKRLLKGCRNFKTVEENFELLLYGYIRKYTNDLYHRFYVECNDLVFKACYNCQQFEQVKDIWSLSDIERWNVFGEIFRLDANKNIIRLVRECENPQITFGTCIINDKSIRKIWKIKVLKNYSAGKVFTFRIGITGVDNRVRWSTTREDKLITYELRATDSVVPIKEDDVISVLFVNSGTRNDKADILIQFAINDVIHAKQFDTTNIDLRYKEYKLSIKMTQKEELQLLK
eukprot:158801_1